MIQTFSHSVYTDELPGGTAYLGEAIGATVEEIIEDVKRRKMPGLRRLRVNFKGETIIIERT